MTAEQEAATLRATVARLRQALQAIQALYDSELVLWLHPDDPQRRGEGCYDCGRLRHVEAHAAGCSVGRLEAILRAALADAGGQ